MSAYSDASTIMQGLAAIIAAVAGTFGVRQYWIATDAEARLKRSAEVENEIRIAAHFTEVMKVAEGWGQWQMVYARA